MWPAHARPKYARHVNPKVPFSVNVTHDAKGEPIADVCQRPKLIGLPLALWWIGGRPTSPDQAVRLGRQRVIGVRQKVRVRPEGQFYGTVP